MSNVIEDLWNGYVLLEGQKVSNRLNQTAQDQQAYSVPSKPADAQAKASSYTQTSGSGFQLNTRTMLIGGGILAGLVGLYFVTR